MKTIRNNPNFIFFLVLILGLQSCVSHQQLLTLEKANLSYNQPEDIANNITIRIQPDDILTITVHSFDPEAASPFNSAQSRGNNSQLFNSNNLSAAQLFLGYLVNAQGYVELPILGKIKLAELTLDEASSKIVEALSPYLKDATVNVKYLNFKVTVLGEVNAPSTYTVPNTRVSIFDALGLARDLTKYANRNNVLVIRESNGKREFGRLDLQSKDIFSSPYFYLTQNDVVFVEPIKPRTATVADPLQRYVSYISAGLSILTLIVALSR